MRLLIDADGLVYRCGFAVEKTKYLVTYGKKEDEEEFIAYCDDHKHAKEKAGEHGFIWSRKEVEPVENALHLIDTVIGALPPHNDRELWLTPAIGNFREGIATQAKYKGNRDYTTRPKYYREITNYLIDRYGARYTEGQEADDELGIRLTDLGDQACIVSFDKDLLQIPGQHYNWVTREGNTIGVKEASLNFYRQILSGDPVDNVPGVPGIGAVKAGKILADVKSPKEAWGLILEEYRNAFGEEGSEIALETARLVYIRRRRDEIWSPPEG